MKAMKTLFFLLTAGLLLAVSFATFAQTAKDVQYATSSTDAYLQERCKLDVYAPDGANDLPVVVWFHGGGLTGGDKRSIPRDRNLELYGRYEETAYFWRLFHMVGHPDATIYELQGFTHGNMADPAVQILRDNIRRILRKRN